MADEVQETTEETTPERREEKRFDLSQVGVWFKDAAAKDDKKVPFRAGGKLTDFSSKGIGLLTQEPIKEGDEIVLRIKYGVRQAHAQGHVIRRSLVSGKDYQVGIELEGSEKHFLPRLIVSHFQAQKKQLPVGLLIAAGIGGLVLGFLLGWML